VGAMTLRSGKTIKRVRRSTRRRPSPDSLAIAVIVSPASNRTLISSNLASRAVRADRCVERRCLSPSEMLREPFLAYGPVGPFASTSLALFSGGPGWIKFNSRVSSLLRHSRCDDKGRATSSRGLRSAATPQMSSTIAAKIIKPDPRR